MANNIVLLGDTGTHRGAMITASAGIRASGQQACVTGDIYDCADHGRSPVLNVRSKVKSKGKAMLSTGDVANCGCVLTGSSRVKIG
jgi:uncharacterized Zn-binding protein involved in type VI secretion